MAETKTALPRHEINNLAYDPTAITAVQTLLESAAGMLRTNDKHWNKAAKVSELLTEVENAAAILRRRCDYLCEREIAV